MVQRQEWKEHDRYLIVEEHGSVILDLYAEPQDGGDYSFTAWVFGLWVDPDFRRQGIASGLLDQAEKIARDNGHTELFMYWRGATSPVEVLEYYKERGYHIVHTDADGHVLKKYLW